MEEAECVAVLGGVLKKRSIVAPSPMVTSPSGPPSSGTWTGAIEVRQLLTPPPIGITCGEPITEFEFEPVHLESNLPPGITVAEPELLLQPDDLSTSGPYGPPIDLVSDEPIKLTYVHSGGDVCDLETIPFVEPLKVKATFGRPPLGYGREHESGTYRWDASTWSAGQVEVEIESPTVSIICDRDWRYYLHFALDFDVEPDKPLESGFAHHLMFLDGKLSRVGDDRVRGVIYSRTVEVETSGAVVGHYSGPTSFTIPVEGFYSVGSDGKGYVDLPHLSGGAGVSWHFSYTVLGTELRGVNPNIVQDHLSRINAVEQPSDRAGYFRLPAEDADDMFVDFTSSGDEFVHRNWDRRNTRP